MPGRPQTPRPRGYAGRASQSWRAAPSEAGEIPALSRNGGSQASGEDEWDEPGRLDPRVRISPRLKGTRRLQVAAQRLIGIGVGPGDPELITIKAIQALQGSAPILVPATEASAQGPGRAETIDTACPIRAFIKVDLPLLRRPNNPI